VRLNDPSQRLLVGRVDPLRQVGVAGDRLENRHEIKVALGWWLPRQIEHFDRLAAQRIGETADASANHTQIGLE